MENVNSRNYCCRKSIVNGRKSFYSDAAAAEVLHGALTKLITDYAKLQKASVGGVIPVNPTVSSSLGGGVIMSPLRRVVDPEDAYVGEQNTRAISHINPRDRNNPATFLGGIPGAIPVNQRLVQILKFSCTIDCQMYQD